MDLLQKDSLSEQARAALAKALAMMEMCGPDAPPEMVAYIDRAYRDATPPGVVAVLLAGHGQEPKMRPRITAPVRRGLQAMAALIDTGAANEDIVRACKWIAEEFAFPGGVTLSTPSGPIGYDGKPVR